jgi:glucose-6-phosphate 1-dehydrogenase
MRRWPLRQLRRIANMTTQYPGATAPEFAADNSPGDRCILVLFGASGDLTKRLLMPTLYNLACDRLLPKRFAVVGMALEEWSTDEFRERMSRDIRSFNTRPEFDSAVWNELCKSLYYLPGKFDDAGAFQRLRERVAALDAEHDTGGNLLFYLAVPPTLIGLISSGIGKAGFKNQPGWKRIIVEKPFGRDLHSAEVLNTQLVADWQENEIYRVDHYLGKETVRNILAFRFANGMFEPLWNRDHIDHIQISVTESVGVEWRGNYYDRAGALRDMVQNHMLQMIASVCMEPAISFAADDIRDEKAKVLRAIQVYAPEEVPENTVRGQYGAGRMDGKDWAAYRQEPNVSPQSNVETFAALRLYIDNWRWEGVPIYLRTGKALWARGTNIVVQFKKPPARLFQGTAVAKLAANRLIFHIQPSQGIETRFHAKVPGPASLQLQPVNMRFDYDDAFQATRGTGYEVMIYSCMKGDATLFSRIDLVETAWRIVQPILDYWAVNPAADFPNYAAGTWGPLAAHDLIERDGRHWFEIIHHETLERVPLFQGGDALLLNQIGMALQTRAVAAGEIIIREGSHGNEMFVIGHGEVEVLDSDGEVVDSMHEGDVFGEVALLRPEASPATIRAKTLCDLFVLGRSDFARILRDHPHFAQTVEKIAQERYNLAVSARQLIARK